METIMVVTLIIILAAQLAFIFLQHYFYNKKIDQLKISMKSIEVQLEDKIYVLKELRQYMEKN